MFSSLRNFVFIHIPKTGGTSIRRVLHTLTGDPNFLLFGHPTIADIEKLFNEEFFRRVFKFCFVRNPWDRLVSNYFYMLQAKFSASYERAIAAQNKVLEMGSFENFVRKFPTQPQTAWMFGIDGKMKMDFVGRYENLIEDWLKVVKRVGLPESELPIKNRSLHQHYSHYYTPQLVEYVQNQYSEEIKLFDYRFQWKSF